MTQLIMMRHGEAGSHFGSGRDADRELTARGVDDTVAVVQAFKNMQLAVDEIIASPYRRAQQTADIAARAFGVEITTADLITPYGSVGHIAQTVAASTGGTVLVVTHMPLVGMAAAACLGAPAAQFNFGTSAAAIFSLPRRAAFYGELVAFLRPEALLTRGRADG